jgi:hypothetical protein
MITSAERERGEHPRLLLISMILAVVAVLSASCLIVSSDPDDSDADGDISGQCGDDLTWNFDPSTGQLTITGSGPMYNYSWEDTRWDGNEDAIESVSLPAGVTSIGSYAFYDCTSLQSIDIPAGVTSIGEDAFYKCKSLQSIDIPVGITSIGDYAFSWCESLQSIDIPAGVTSIGDYAFEYCTSLQSINVDDNNGNYSSVGGVLFDEDKTTLIVYPAGKTETEYVIPASVTSIEFCAFSSCTSLQSIDLSAGIISIEFCAFEYCTSLQSVSFGDNSKLEFIGEGAFSDCTSLQSIDIPAGVTSIGNRAFEDCTSLQSIDIPAGVTSIGEGAFYFCASLQSIDIPAGVTSIGDVAFVGCSSLQSIDIPAGVASIGNDAFSSCTSLQSINVDGNNGNYSSVEGVLFDKDKTTLIAYPAGKTDVGYAIPASITSIGNFAFSGCISIQSIDLPTGVTSIGNYAFFSCTYLESINIPASITSIGDWAFEYCTSLQSIDIPAGVTSIGNGAFYECTSLKSIDIPGGVTSIGNGAFYECTSLQSIDLPAGVTSIGEGAFSGLHFIVDGTEVEQTASNLAGRYWTGTGDGYLFLTERSTSYIDSSSEMYRDGDIVTFTLGFTGVKDVKSILFTLSYEGSSAEMVGYRWLVPGAIQQFDGLEGIAAWSDAKDIDGGVFEISFRLSEDADEFTLSCDSMLNPGDMSFAASKTIYRQLYIDGDLDDDGLVTSDDAIYLLYSTFLPDRYPLNQDADFNDDGKVDSDDAVYLLYHTFLPDRYPLHPKSA